ncbi:hypothetical protein V6N11_013635 [Hibiscus sabdariffa]|uniref:Uncharacterized protein n=2 Tax=Hibiscus sabdariffa TaxID=183260 RepID=A0ABR2CQQ0_9ROSI
MKQGMASLAQAPPLATSIARIPQIRSRNLQLLKASKLPPPLLTLHHIHIRRQSSVCCKKLSRWKPPLLTDTDGNSFLEKKTFPATEERTRQLKLMEQLRTITGCVR